MWIIGCDFHPSFQQIALVNQATGEYRRLRLEHKGGEAEQFYRGLAGQQVRVGMEATGSIRWFERLLGELGFQLWVGDPARIRAAAAHKPKTDKRDADLLLQLLLEKRFPKIWMPTPEQRDARQLVLHRHRLVQLRTRAKNQLYALATNEGLHPKKRAWTQAGQSELMALPLPQWASVRRQDWQELLGELDERIEPLDQAMQQEAKQRREVQLLMTHPGVGPVVAMAFVLTLCDPHRFQSSKQVAAYLGLVPLEQSSGKGRQRLGHITKQGNTLLRSLLVEAGHIAVRYDAQWRRKFLRLSMKKNRSLATVAVARNLAVRLWWMWKLGLDYGQMKESRSHAEQLV
jgi:transposase